MYIQCLHAFASLSGVFSLFSPLNILHTFFLPVCSLSVPSLLPCSSSFPSSTAPPGARPSVSLSSLPCLPSACPPLLLPAVCSVAAVCPLSPSPFIPVGRAPEAPRRSSVCAAAVCPSLVRHQAQNAVTVWADAPRIYPRPYPCPLVMCCRGSFRGLSRGFLPSVRARVLLPAVVWWQ